MNKLLCFGALLPTPESQRLIVAHRAPLRSLKSKNSPLTHTHTCIAIHKHALTHPLTDTNTPFCPLPFPKPSCWPVWKISAIRALAAKSFPARYGPHISRFHTREHRRVSITGVLFLPSLWVAEWQSDGRTHLVEAFQWHEWLQTQACECKCANTNTNAHHSIHKHRQSALKAHEMLIYFSLRDQRR